MDRRNCIRNLTLLSGGIVFSQSFFGQTSLIQKKRKTILLCTGIQYANMGDHGHVTGILNLLTMYLPEARIVLWPKIDLPEFDELISANWPDVRIIHSKLADGKPVDEEIGKVAKQVDFVIGGHGEETEVSWVAKNFNKPYGIFGVTVGAPPEGTRKEFIDSASFYFTRETASLENLKKAGVRCPVTDFVPDATFGSNVQDEQKSSVFMRKNELKYKKFLCVVPRLRVTPYYRIAPELRYDPSPWSDERVREVDQLNNKHKEEDHAKARAAMIAWVRQTGYPVLLCPEMIHNMDIFDELLLNPLPDDVKKNVIKKEHFWRIDEATTVYKNATAVISLECHSPIIAYTQGTPAFYLRQPEDTIKGQMYYDIGLPKWVFEIEKATGSDVAIRLMDLINDHQTATSRLSFAMNYVREKQKEAMMKIRKTMGL
ncbi:MAG TPA: polysaccharide pyruvyl transferase [Prolixibacteraceae bacterium]|nr:polysaccharide pyruvyl transferase [Marinilabiliales bacterium]HBL76817.1 polysaccharide pyruvyl transferase [Prolixibacteraceae bacterium]HCU62802.1 polysaccharide pyruvyl transferase [Prolixibacteraceae bacterium]